MHTGGDKPHPYTQNGDKTMKTKCTKVYESYEDYFLKASLLTLRDGSS